MPHLSRSQYLLATLATLALGLLSRLAPVSSLPLPHAYLGDTLWATMIFWALGVLCPALRPRLQLWLSLCFCYAIECSQLYQAPWFNQLRDLPGARLVFGYGFLWTDILSYTFGCIAAFLLRIYWSRRGIQADSPS